MVKQIVFALLVLIGSSVKAQDKITKSKIKFIDGSEVHAVIKENSPGKYVKIILPGNEEVTIKYSSILSIKHKDYSYYSKYVRSKGFYMEGSTSLLFGKATEYGSSRLGIALRASGNYQFNAHLSLGLGIEPTAILITNEKFLIPVFTSFKFTILERKVTPVLMLDAGWSFVTNTKKNEEFSSIRNEGGWYTRPTIGIQISNFCLSFGYQLQKITTTEEHTWRWQSTHTITEERLMKNVSLSGSFKF